MRERGLCGADALEEVIRMHDRALLKNDFLAASVGKWGADTYPFVAR